LNGIFPSQLELDEDFVEVAIAFDANDIEESFDASEVVNQDVWRFCRGCLKLEVNPIVD